MRICIIAFVALLVGCSGKNSQSKEETVCLFDTVTVNRTNVDKDSLSFSFLESDAASFGFYLALEYFNLRSKQVKVVIENLRNDTLLCGNVIYQIKDSDSWVTIISAVEDSGCPIFPNEKVRHSYSLPYDYNFHTGMYKIVFPFTNKKDERFNVNAYFEVSRK